MGENVNLENLAGKGDELSSFELGQRDEMIKKGLIECKSLLGKQNSSNMFYFYEGSIEGFKECRNFIKISQYENRLKELHQEETDEMAYNCDDKELREQCGIYGSERKMDINEVWEIKGRRTQVDYVYQRLLASRLILTQIAENISL